MYIITSVAGYVECLRNVNRAIKFCAYAIIRKCFRWSYYGWWL